MSPAARELLDLLALEIVEEQASARAKPTPSGQKVAPKPTPPASSPPRPTS